MKTPLTDSLKLRMMTIQGQLTSAQSWFLKLTVASTNACGTEYWFVLCFYLRNAQIAISLSCDWLIQNKLNQSDVSSRSWLSRQSQLCLFRSLLSLFQVVVLHLSKQFWIVQVVSSFSLNQDLDLILPLISKLFSL